MHDIKWIFFDIGGVLADETAYQDYRRNTCLEVVRRYISTVTKEEYALAYQEASLGVGSLTEGVVRVLMERHQSSQVNEVIDHLRSEFRSGPSYLEMEEVRPEAIEVVGRLASSYKLGVIANQPDGVKGLLESAGILQYLSDFTIASDTVGKPNPEYYLQVLGKTQAIPTESLMVDDNLTRGILPAKALGMKTAWFGQTQKPEGVDYAVLTLRELEKLLLL